MITKNWVDYNKILPFSLDSNITTLDLLREINEAVIPEDRKKIKTILEVGCSNGRYLRYLKWMLNVKELYGLDLISEGFGRNCINFIQGDGFHLPFKKDSFDLVCSFGFLEHFRRKGRDLLLEEMLRVLKEGGYLVVNVPNLQPSLRFLKVKVLDLFREIKHHKLNIGEFISELAHCQIISKRFIGWFPHFRNLELPRPKFLVGNRLLSDDLLLIAKLKK